MREQYIGIDIGSTFTKGALFSLHDEQLELTKRLDLPTDREDVSSSAISIYDRLLKGASSEQVRTGCSSSAHGGLAMVSIGLVPSFTVDLAKAAALSAGAKLIASYSYRLIPEHLEQIEGYEPDIILLSGGTDGGNRGYILENAQALASYPHETVVIYAGNRDVKDRALGILKTNSRIRTYTTENILPSLDRQNLEPVRELIKQIFMERIIQGKGLLKASRHLRADIQPTPGSVLEFLERNSILNGTALVDIGGATTDCYSSVSSPDIDDYEGVPVFHQGLQNLNSSRSVEGDLGMRLNAVHAAALSESPDQRLAEYAGRVAEDPSYLPDEQELEFDRRLAASCCRNAILRHTGHLRPVYTMKGIQYRQYGKSLLGVERILLTGGAARAYAESMGEVITLREHNEGVPLLPKAASFWVDEQYLIPLLAQAVDIPKQYVRTFLEQKCLKQIHWRNIG